MDPRTVRGAVSEELDAVADAIEAEWYRSRPEPFHRVVWKNRAVPSLECACGRRFVGPKAYDDLAAHIASKQPT
jgi:hypothetical protein